MRAALLHLTCVLLLLTWNSEPEIALAVPAVTMPHLSTAEFSSRHPIRLGDLLVGQRLAITIISQGCYHYYRSDIELAVDLTASLRLTGSGAHLGGNTVQLPTKHLAPSQVQGLDRQLDRYRQPSDQYCTGDTELLLSLYDGSHLLQVERYRDRSCTHGDSADVEFEGLVFSSLYDME